MAKPREPARRPSWRGTKTSSTARGYGYKWQKASKAFLDANPFCFRCERQGRLRAATIVNHRIPHRGDLQLFWDRTNWESSCKPCHDGPTQAEERSGMVKGTDASGRPLDPAHPWNRGGTPKGPGGQKGTGGGI